MMPCVKPYNTENAMSTSFAFFFISFTNTIMFFGQYQYFFFLIKKSCKLVLYR